MDTRTPNIDEERNYPEYRELSDILNKKISELTLEDCQLLLNHIFDKYESFYDEKKKNFNTNKIEVQQFAEMAHTISKVALESFYITELSNLIVSDKTVMKVIEDAIKSCQSKQAQANRKAVKQSSTPIIGGIFTKVRESRAHSDEKVAGHSKMLDLVLKSLSVDARLNIDETVRTNSQQFTSVPLADFRIENQLKGHKTENAAAQILSGKLDEQEKQEAVIKGRIQEGEDNPFRTVRKK